MSEISYNLSIDGRITWHSLSDYMKFLLMMGLDFPLDAQDLFCVRYYSCISINNMYIRRKSFEPP